MCGDITDKDMLMDVWNKNGGDSSNEEKKELEAEEMPIPSSLQVLCHMYKLCSLTNLYMYIYTHTAPITTYWIPLHILIHGHLPFPLLTFVL